MISQLVLDKVFSFRGMLFGTVVGLIAAEELLAEGGNAKSKRPTYNFSDRLTSQLFPITVMSLVGRILIRL